LSNTCYSINNCIRKVDAPIRTINKGEEEGDKGGNLFGRGEIQCGEGHGILTEFSKNALDAQLMQISFLELGNT
jgi:hypothetical protein